MPVRGVERITDAGGVEIGLRILGVGASGVLEVLYANVPGNSWNANRLGKFVEIAQAQIDQRIPLASLPADDPAKLADPGRPDFFWDGTDLVSRPVVIEDVYFTGTELHFRLKRNR